MSVVKITKFYSSYFFLYMIIFIPILNAQENINFNYGKVIDENNISNMDSKESKNTVLNLDKNLNEEVIKNINFASQNNSINEKEDFKIKEFKKIDNTKNIFSNLYKNIFKKEEHIIWQTNNLTNEEIQKRIFNQDISVSPYSINLPEGNGTVEMGEKIYQAKCMSCHGTKGKAEQLEQKVESLRGGQNAIKIIAFESLTGGLGSLSSEMPIRSVGSFWQHSTTLFDYIRRSMPYFEPQSLSNEEYYAVTAYVLFINNIITKDQNINANTLQKVNMPNKAGFIDSWGPDWWRSWIHQKYSIIFTCFLLIGILLVILFAKKLTQNKKKINIIKILLTTTIFIWIGMFHGIPLGTQKVYNSYNNLKLNNGDWENILFEPIFVILSSFVIITTLIWGRGIFCGWICPFGTIQDMIYKFKSLFKFVNYEVPDNIHNKLIYIKYIILTAIIISAIYTSGNNLLFEFEPFETIIENKFNTSTILILWSLVLLSFVFFIERGFCRYLCPTGAALSLTTQFQVINWLTTIKSEGSKDSPAFSIRCPTKAIKSDGSISEKECILCLSCQIVYNDKNLSKRNKNSIRKKRNNSSTALGTS